MPVHVRSMSERKRVTPRPSDVLFKARYAEGTQKQYSDAVQHFLRWVRATGAKTRSAREMDIAFCDFICAWFDEKRAKQTAINAYYGLPRPQGSYAALSATDSGLETSRAI